MEREEHTPETPLSAAEAPLRDATERLAVAAAEGAPGALLSALLDGLEAAAGLRRATLWSPAETGDALLAGPTPWMQLRSRGPVTPSPDGAGAGHVVLRSEALGALVYERETFDDGSREAREDIAEALFRCADVLATSAPSFDGHAEVPPPFSMGDSARRDDADDRAA